MSEEDERSKAFFLNRDGKIFKQSVAKEHEQAFKQTGNITSSIGKALVDETPQESRQHMRRMDAFREMFDTFLVERVTSVGPAPNVIYVAWEEFQKMHTEYKEAEAVGEHHDFPFQPLSAYARKLHREGKKPVRHLFANECGVWTDRNGVGRICILKDQGPGDVGGKYFQVPESYKGDKS